MKPFTVDCILSKHRFRHYEYQLAATLSSLAAPFSDLVTRKKYVALVETARERGAKVFVFSRSVRHHQERVVARCPCFAVWCYQPYTISSARVDWSIFIVLLHSILPHRCLEKLHRPQRSAAMNCVIYQGMCVVLFSTYSARYLGADIISELIYILTAFSVACLLPAPSSVYFCVSVMSSMHVTGEQLGHLTGIAAVLRFPLPEIEDDDDSDEVGVSCGIVRDTGELPQFLLYLPV